MKMPIKISKPRYVKNNKQGVIDAIIARMALKGEDQASEVWSEEQKTDIQKILEANKAKINKNPKVDDTFIPPIIYSEEPQPSQSVKYNSDRFAIMQKPDPSIQSFDASLLVPKQGITQLQQLNEQIVVSRKGPSYQHPSRASLKDFLQQRCLSEIGPFTARPPAPLLSEVDSVQQILNTAQSKPYLQSARQMQELPAIRISNYQQMIREIITAPCELDYSGQASPGVWPLSNSLGRDPLISSKYKVS